MRSEIRDRHIHGYGVVARRIRVRNFDREQHWSFFFDSDASVMEGNHIEDQSTTETQRHGEEFQGPRTSSSSSTNSSRRVNSERFTNPIWFFFGSDLSTQAISSIA